MKETLAGAQIGFGYIAEKGHLPAYRSKATTRPFDIVAVADVCEARRALAKKLLPNARIYSDAKTLLGAEAHRLDFVDIATPPCDHAALAHAALEQGLHVLCEKPLASSAHDAAAMLEHAVRQKRVVFPSHNYKHAPVIRAVRKFLDEGHIGEVRLVTLETFRTTHAKGVAEWQPDWRRSRRVSGGGIAMDHGSHTFYLAFDWLCSYPTAITAKMSHQNDLDTEDNFSCTVTFPTGTAVAQLTWNAGVRKVIYTLHGDRGAIKVEDDDIELSVLATATSPARVERSQVASHWMDASHSGWFASLFDRFANAIDQGDYAGKEAREALLCVQLIETAYRSARNGCRELPLGDLASVFASAS
jgi:predicted dehydrogenase